MRLCIIIVVIFLLYGKRQYQSFGIPFELFFFLWNKLLLLLKETVTKRSYRFCQSCTRFSSQNGTNNKTNTLDLHSVTDLSIFSKKFQLVVTNRVVLHLEDIFSLYLLMYGGKHDITLCKIFYCIGKSSVSNLAHCNPNVNFYKKNRWLDETFYVLRWI